MKERMKEIKRRFGGGRIWGTWGGRLVRSPGHVYEKGRYGGGGTNESKHKVSLQERSVKQERALKVDWDE
jgi:hypothetical protein